MQFSFSDANAVRVIAPAASTRNGNTTAAARKSSLYAIADQVSLGHLAVSETEQNAPTNLSPALSEVPPAAPLAVVRQTIDDLEAQGLLMVFDRHDQVAKRLTEDLTAAGVLQDKLAIEPPIATPLQFSEIAVDSQPL